MEEVFGTNSRLQSDEWVAKVKSDSKWVFDAIELRKRLFAAADVDKKH